MLFWLVESLARLNSESVCILCTSWPYLLLMMPYFSGMQPSTSFAMGFVPKTSQQRPNREYYPSRELQEEFNKLSGW